MIHHLYYNYKDLLKTPRIAIGPQRLFIATLGMSTAHLVWVLFNYLSMYFSGYSIEKLWHVSGLLPFAFRYELSTFSVILGWFGIFSTIFIILQTNTALSRAAYMYLRNNYFYTSKQAIRFAFKRSTSIMLG